VVVGQNKNKLCTETIFSLPSPVMETRFVFCEVGTGFLCTFKHISGFGNFICENSRRLNSSSLKILKLYPLLYKFVSV
jgi:hypothetical protein